MVGVILVITEWEVMFATCRTILQFTHLTRVNMFSSKTSPALQRLSSYKQCKKHFGCSFIRFKENEIPSTLTKYELFSEETAPIILDVEEERQKIIFNENMTDEFEGLSRERGTEGVFDVKELVKLLKKEQGEDIFVVQIPPECNYADYMVIVSGRSKKHMEAMSYFVRQLYKIRVAENSHIPILEGKTSDTWKAIDLGNIILHVFSREGRKVYDLETLWSVGRDFDTLSLRQCTSGDLFRDYSKILAGLSPNN